MDFHKIFRAAVAMLALIVVTVSLHADRRRAVKHNPAPPEIVATVSGTVLDSATGQPVRHAEVTIGSKSDRTDSAGKYRIRNVSVFAVTMDVVVERSGYQSKTMAITTSGEHVVDFRLVSLPTVSVKTTDAVTRQIDFETIRFGYTLPFAGYVAAESEDFCKPDGTAIVVDRSEMKKITGPATKADVSACCTEGQVLEVRLELKTNEVTDVTFVDSCNGYNIDLIGRNHTTGEYEYLHFTDITEIVFP